MASLHENETRILGLLREKRSASLEEIEKSLGISTDSILLAIESLAEGGAVNIEKAKAYDASLTEEGKGCLESFPEEALAKSMSGRKQERLDSIRNNVGVVWAKKNGWIEIANGYAKLTKAGEAAAAGGTDYAQRSVLNRISASGKSGIGNILDKNREMVEGLAKRGLLRLKERERVCAVKITDAGMKQSAAKPDEGIGALSSEMISSRGWEGRSFKRYDVNASSEALYPARQHILHEFIDFIRDAWLRMGFSEIDGPIVESAFWVFDALFEPQDHPAREMQDTFFLSNPKQIDIEDFELLSRVKKMHEKGWKEEWKV